MPFWLFITVQEVSFHEKLTVLNKSIITALCVALCVVLPMALHAIPKGGVLFSPMHLPVLLCGLVCGAPSGLICGILGPFISSMLTGMPAFGYMPIMMIELGLYGLISGLVMQLLRSGKLVIDLYAALIIAMLGGRVITGILRALIFAGGSYSWSAWAAGYFVSCLPGIILQLILLPTIMWHWNALISCRFVTLPFLLLQRPKLHKSIHHRAGRLLVLTEKWLLCLTTGEPFFVCISV